jgi:sterol desaturase/sphingolipid hydroxylase (fatty acid hydroxylase superfamily)
MHPCEHMLYFTRCLPLFLCHPVMFYFVNTRAMLGPAPGHHGFNAAYGSHFHYIHHAKYEFNYGTSRVVPIDNLMGTHHGPDNKALPADVSMAAVTYVLGLPYLLPCG